MLRDLEAIVVIANLTAVALGYMWRRRRQSRRSANMKHIDLLERENEEIDEKLKRMRKNDREV